MNNLGVFGWIRESVKALGIARIFGRGPTTGYHSRPGRSALNPQLASVLLTASPATHVTAIERSSEKPNRKRLGRSLEQLRTQPSATGKGA